jgi:hypothetical protein
MIFAFPIEDDGLGGAITGSHGRLAHKSSSMLPAPGLCAITPLG